MIIRPIESDYTKDKVMKKMNILYIILSIFVASHSNVISAQQSCSRQYSLFSCFFLKDPKAKEGCKAIKQAQQAICRWQQQIDSLLSKNSSVRRIQTKIQEEKVKISKIKQNL